MKYAIVKPMISLKSRKKFKVRISFELLTNSIWNLEYNRSLKKKDIGKREL